MCPRRAVVPVLFSALALSACGGGGGPNGSSDGTPARNVAPGVGKPVTGRTLTVGIASDPGALDPATNGASTPTLLYPFLYDTLVAPNAKNEMVANLATKWTVTPTRATFTIREGVTCSDGSPVTPSVVGENLDYLKSPKVQYPALGTLDYTVRADDRAGTVTIEFGEPVGFVLEMMRYVQIVCGEGLRERDVLERASSGSGPYTLTEVVPNDHYTMTLRKGYQWGPNGAGSAVEGMPRTIVFRVVPNATTTANLLLAGDLDASSVSGAEVERLERSDLQVARSATGITQATYNQLPGHPTTDPAVRTALQMTIDRASIAKVVDGQVAASLVPAALNPCPNPGAMEAVPPYDPAAAAALLDDAGWATGAGGVRSKSGKELSITLLGVDTGEPAFRAATELVARQWRALGAKVQTRVLPEGPAVQALGQGAWDAIPLLTINVPVPSQLVPLVTGPAPPKGSNWGGLDNPAFQRHAAKAAGTADAVEACRMWNEAELALIDGVDLVPTVSFDTIWFVAKDVGLTIASSAIVPTSLRMRQG